MKRLYTLALSALVLAASASVAVPTVRVAKAKATNALTEHVSVVKATPSSAKRSVAKKGVEAQAVEVPESYAVYQNGTVGQGLNVNSWWNVILNTQDADPTGEGTVFSMTYNPNEPGGGATGPNFCAGIQAPDQSTITGPLHSATLTFQYYATTTCDITIRLDGDGKEENKTISVAADDVNKWATATFNVATDYPEVSAIWKAWTNTGLGDVFGVVVEQFNADTKVYFNNVVYTNLDQEWTKPYVEEPFCPTPAVPQQAAENVKSLFSGAYEAATWFNVGSWGQSTKYKQLTAENNAPVAYLTDFNYLGWEFGEHLDLTDMEYMHVDFYPVTATAFGFTPIGNGENLYAVDEADVNVEQWNSYDVPLSYFEGVTLSDVYQIKFDKGNGGEGYIANVYFYKSAGEEPEPEPEPEEYTWTSLGKGKYAASVIAATYGVSSDPVEVDVYEAEEAKGVYKFVGVWPQLASGLELVIDATDPDFVKVPVQYTGYVDDVDGKTYIASLSALYTKEEFAEAGAESYIISMTDGYISIPADALMLNWPEAPEDSEYGTDPEVWYIGPGCPDGYALLPGAQEPDPNEGWTSKGEATFMDGWVLPGLGIDQTDKANWYTVELQQKDSDPNIYRLVDPYHGNSPAAEYNESTNIGYIQFDVTDPDHVAFATNVSAGFANSELGVNNIYCSNTYGTFTDWGLTLDVIIAYLGEDYTTATFKDGVVTLPSSIVDGEYESDACFGLASGGDDNGLYWTDTNDIAVNMAAMIWFPGVTPEYTSITEINSDADNEEVIFNLRGQRISHPTVPGIYIRNNAKVFVR